MLWRPFSSPDSLTFRLQDRWLGKDRINVIMTTVLSPVVIYFVPIISLFVPEKDLINNPLEGVELPWLIEKRFGRVPYRQKCWALFLHPIMVMNDLPQPRRIKQEHEWPLKNRIYGMKAVQALILASEVVMPDDTVWSITRSPWEQQLCRLTPSFLLWADHGWQLGEKEHCERPPYGKKLTRGFPLSNLWHLTITAKGDCGKRRLIWLFIPP